MIEPVDPFERGVFDGLKVPPRTAAMDDLRLEQADDRFGERVVVGVTHAAHRRLRAGLGQALGVPDRQILGEFNPSSQHVPEGRC